LLGFSAAHATSGLIVRQHSRVASVALELAAVFGAIVAVARIQCPGGAARCSLDDGVTADALDRLHGLGVVAYEVAFVVGVIAASRWLLRSTRRSDVTIGGALVLLCMVSLTLLIVMPDAEPGTVQRAWLLVNSVSIIVVAITWSKSSVARAAMDGSGQSS
jgi:hypothetical protein